MHINRQGKRISDHGKIRHGLTHDQECFWEVPFLEVSEIGFFDVFHGHQHFVLVRLLYFRQP